MCANSKLLLLVLKNSCRWMPIPAEEKEELYWVLGEGEGVPGSEAFV